MNYFLPSFQFLKNRIIRWVQQFQLVVLMILYYLFCLFFFVHRVFVESFLFSKNCMRAG